MTYQILIHRGAAALLVVGIASGAAATASPAAPSHDLSAPSSTANDPRALQLLQQMFDAEAALRSFSAVITMNGTGHTPFPSVRMTVSFRKPNLLAITSNDGKRTAHIVCDGAHVFGMITGTTTYRKDVAPPDLHQVIRFANKTAEEVDFLDFLFDNGGMASVTRQLHSVVREGSGTIGGVPVRIVSTRGNHPGDGRVVFAVGAADHVLRRMTFIMASPAKEAGTLTVTLTDVRVNPALSKASFTFVVPPGASEARAVPPSPAGVPKVP